MAPAPADRGERRTSGEYDAVVDFDRVLSDGVHPNAAGYDAMARAVDLNAL
ncbi:hypothetical protein ACFV9D_18910 [Streptomyces sp. NPDC059875]|uniref:hypothetical protein n=1 Tax=unclassified Streptomyces TaxID=2593676 RepID=UPI003665A163